MTMTDSITRDDGHGGHPDNAYLIIEHLYTSLGYADSVEKPNWFNAETVGTFYPWDQHEFYPEDLDWNLPNFRNRDNGYIYVPTQCETKQCKLHFVLHGRGGSPSEGKAKYNQIGALNDIIMVYPTTKSWESFSSANDPENFMKNTGVMPMAFKKMIARLTGTEDN